MKYFYMKYPLVFFAAPVLFGKFNPYFKSITEGKLNCNIYRCVSKLMCFVFLSLHFFVIIHAGGDSANIWPWPKTLTIANHFFIILRWEIFQGKLFVKQNAKPLFLYENFAFVIFKSKAQLFFII